MPKTVSQTRLEAIEAVCGQIHGRPQVENYIKLGQLLTAQKKEVDHGDWTGWMEENLPKFRCSVRMAQHAMDFYEHQDKIETVSFIKEAITIIRIFKSGDKAKPPKGHVCKVNFATKEQRDEFAKLMEAETKTSKQSLGLTLLEIVRTFDKYRDQIKELVNAGHSPRLSDAKGADSNVRRGALPPEQRQRLSRAG